MRGLIRNPDHAADLRADGSEPVACDLEAASVEEVVAVLDAVLHEPRSARLTLYVIAGEDSVDEALAAVLSG